MKGLAISEVLNGSARRRVANRGSTPEDFLASAAITVWTEFCLRSNSIDHDVAASIAMHWKG
jgi:hypothetical protein